MCDSRRAQEPVSQWPAVITVRWVHPHQYDPGIDTNNNTEYSHTAMTSLWVILSLLSSLSSSSAKLTETRRETKELQKALNHNTLVVVIDGVLERLIGDPNPDPLLLINFPDINTQFKVHVLEDSKKIKFTLAREDGKSIMCCTDRISGVFVFVYFKFDKWQIISAPAVILLSTGDI